MRNAFRIFLSISAGLGLIYLFRLRPLHLRWGATQEEFDRSLPGDNLVPYPIFRATRAITIHAPVTQVWKWLVQVGQDRGGTYSYNWLENLFGADMRNAETILPKFQTLHEGDTIWMGSKAHFGGRAYIVVETVEPERAVVFLTQPWTRLIGRRSFSKEHAAGSWAFVLERLDEHTTRLLVRDRAGIQANLAEVVANFVMEPVHFFMQRKMMLGLKQRAESVSIPVESRVPVREIV